MESIRTDDLDQLTGNDLTVFSITAQEFEHGPCDAGNEHCFVPLGAIEPTRYALAVDPALPYLRRRTKMAFIAIDPENVTEFTNDGQMVDLGDDVMFEADRGILPDSIKAFIDKRQTLP
jgi:hypothetical protein